MILLQILLRAYLLHILPCFNFLLFQAKRQLALSLLLLMVKLGTESLKLLRRSGYYFFLSYEIFKQAYPKVINHHWKICLLARCYGKV